MRDEEKATFVIPTLNEQASIQKTIRAGFDCELVEEVIVVDGKSEDETMELAKEEGAKVTAQPGDGKGEAIRIGLKITQSPIAVFMDADILNITPKMISKLIKTVKDGADFVISDFDREGGRVTELTAKPMLEKFFPEIKVNQPLTGEFAGKTDILRKTPIRDGWGAQVDLLIPNWLNEDIDSRETHIGFKDHDRKDLFELTDMARGVGMAILEQAWRYDRIETLNSEAEPLLKAENENLDTHFISSSSIGNSEKTKSELKR